jgi:FtsP/CotA-like multicopper oxidase with cupredoxin domain
MSMDDLHRGSYTGMFGFLIIEGASDPGQFDQEHYLALRDWEPYFTNQAMDNDDLDPMGAQPEKPAVLDTRPVGLEVASDIFSINDKALGAGDPIRVKAGERVMFHFLNASAIENRHLALPGHKFNVIALDGNPVPTPAAVDVVMLGPGERVDAIVEMNQPGVWILGAPEDAVREGGLGVVVEYANQRRSGRRRPNPPGIIRFSASRRPDPRLPSGWICSSRRCRAARANSTASPSTANPIRMIRSFCSNKGPATG